MTTAPHNPAPPAATPRPQGSIRETLESIVIAFVLAFVFRAFVVEAFVIPTGSMAPTLLGEHLRFICPQCGYRFAVGPGMGNVGLKAGDSVPCPMCEFPIPARGGRNFDSGDRILVLKYVYNFSEPRRWDVVVFKNPVGPDQNYIKRLIGLPSEELWIVRGNIFTRPLQPDGSLSPPDVPWQIQRKPVKVQNAVWQPVYHSDYQPIDNGKRTAASERRLDWTMPWQTAGDTADQWQRAVNGLVWRYQNAGTRPGLIQFEFTPIRSRNFYAYNLTMGDYGLGSEPIEDVRLAATVIPLSDALRFSAIWHTQREQFRATIEPDGNIALQSAPRSEENGAAEWTTRATAVIPPLAKGRASRVEFWHADQALSLWIDGKKVAGWEYSTSPLVLRENHFRERTPFAAFEVQGDVELRSLDLDRDLYHTQDGALATGDRPAIIRADRFFCLGDNSPQSEDSRRWRDVNPWVRHLTDVPVGFVPRDLMIGRAFFVYFPAPWPASSQLGGFNAIPNFGDMRFIH